MNAYSRRKFVTGLTGATVAALAGCTSSASEDNQTETQTERERPQVRLQYTYTYGEFDETVQIETTAENVGSETEEDVIVAFGFFDNDGDVFTERTEYIGSMEPGETVEAESNYMLGDDGVRRLKDDGTIKVMPLYEDDVQS